MFPITLDLSTVPLILVGNGPQTLRRLSLVDEDRAARVTVSAPAASEALVRAAGARLIRRWPTPAEIASTKILLIADGVEASALADLVAVARAAGTLVNVEDRPELSDFHSPAIVRRGDLLMTVSTGGRSPALARRIGRFLAEVFGPEWQARLEDLAARREHWRGSGADPSTVSAWTDAWVDRHGQLPSGSETASAVLQQLTTRPVAAAS
ncbi:MAG TPA: NAD(P)-dependent oxidoreductase [Stellaceae bacterium]|nr:NAD(P)-dependent oxidoreductase [Stellaceae bacterium]